LQLLIDEQYNERTANRKQYNTNELAWKPASPLWLTHKDDQSVTPDRPSMPPPIKKETWVAGKQEGQAGRQSYRQLGYRYLVQ
jgi:hypothetical protein